AEIGHVEFFCDNEQLVTTAPDIVMSLARAHRAQSAVGTNGPWWRLRIVVTDTGATEIDEDHGTQPFPEPYLFAPQAYTADLETYPRERLPVWLAAYVRHDERQSRPPAQAVRHARENRTARRADDQITEFPVLWARWATLAAAFVAVNSLWGPRILPSLGRFEGGAGNGSTLYILPGERAVLSGGVWEAPELDAVYNRGGPMPDYYAGAPDWVADSVLDSRAQAGLLSFCYWWENGHWYRGQSPDVTRFAAAVPAVWSADAVVDTVARLMPRQDSRGAAEALVGAAENNRVTSDLLAPLFDPAVCDVDSAFHQLSLAGVVDLAPSSRRYGAGLARPLRERVR
ncbi:hypothetical protein AB0C34_31580, partial [Nocardia sp. NPDC049220]